MPVEARKAEAAVNLRAGGAGHQLRPSGSPRLCRLPVRLALGSSSEGMCTLLHCPHTGRRQTTPQRAC
eukprot:scaffold120338_cov22-Tisochrysis_lutea.AAC.3